MKKKELKEEIAQWRDLYWDMHDHHVKAQRKISSLEAELQYERSKDERYKYRYTEPLRSEDSAKMGEFTSNGEPNPNLTASDPSAKPQTAHSWMYGFEVPVPQKKENAENSAEDFINRFCAIDSNKIGSETHSKEVMDWLEQFSAPGVRLKILW